MFSLLPSSFNKDISNASQSRVDLAIEGNLNLFNIRRSRIQHKGLRDSWFPQIDTTARRRHFKSLGFWALLLQIVGDGIHLVMAWRILSSKCGWLGVEVSVSGRLMVHEATDTEERALCRKLGNENLMYTAYNTSLIL